MHVSNIFFIYISIVQSSVNNLKVDFKKTVGKNSLSLYSISISLGVLMAFVFCEYLMCFMIVIDEIEWFVDPIVDSVRKEVTSLEEKLVKNNPDFSKRYLITSVLLLWCTDY